MALAAVYNFAGLLGDGTVPDLSGYEHHATLSGGALATGHSGGGGLDTSAGGMSVNYRAGDYAINGFDFCMAAWVQSTDAAAAVRIVAASVGTGGNLSRALLLSDASGNVAALVDGTTHSTSTSVRDGAWHHLALSYQNSSGALEVFVDGVSVLSTTATTGAYTYGDSFNVGQGADATTAALAIISDVRYGNTPIVDGATGAAYWRDNPAVDLVLGECSFDQISGGSAANDHAGGTMSAVTLTSNGQAVTGHTNDALGLIDTSDTADGSGTATLPGVAVDRLAVSGWVKLAAAPSSAKPILVIADSGGTARVLLYHGSAGDFLARWQLDADSALSDYIYCGDGTLSDSTWVFVTFTLAPPLAEVYHDGSLGSVGSKSLGGSDTYEPILSDLSKVYIGGSPGEGLAIWDDLRVVANYASGDMQTLHQGTPVAPPPAGPDATADGQETATGTADIAVTGDATSQATGSAAAAVAVDGQDTAPGIAATTTTATGAAVATGTATVGNTRTAFGQAVSTGLAEPTVTAAGQAIAVGTAALPVAARNITIVFGPIVGGWDTKLEGANWSADAPVSGWDADAPVGGWSSDSIIG